MDSMAGSPIVVLSADTFSCARSMGRAAVGIHYGEEGHDALVSQSKDPSRKLHDVKPAPSLSPPHIVILALGIDIVPDRLVATPSPRMSVGPLMVREPDSVNAAILPPLEFSITTDALDSDAPSGVSFRNTILAPVPATASSVSVATVLETAFDGSRNGAQIGTSNEG